MNKSVLVPCLILVLALSARAASPAPAASNPLDRDLGRGLAYHRIHQLPADLPADEVTRKQPCVLDLRYVHGDASAATALAAWLKSHAAAHTPVFILVNAETSSGLLPPPTDRDPVGRIVIIGAAAPGFAPDIALKVSRDTERRAYDAFENGAAIDSLLIENTDKPRNDEAKLAQDRQPDPEVFRRPTAGAGEEAPIDDKSVGPKPASPPIDAALQRAVQLHRTLLALKKL